MFKGLYNFVEKLRPTFSEGGKLHALHSVFDGFDTFLFTPNTTSKRIGTQIHDGSDSKRTMILVVMALVPAMLFGMFNVGYQHLLATGELVRGGMTCALWWKAFGFGLLAVLPYILVSYAVGLGIEFTVAQWKKEEIQEGFLVTGFIIPLIVPINTPLWMVAIATAFAVIFAKEVFGGTGYNIFNVACSTAAFPFRSSAATTFAYASALTLFKLIGIVFIPPGSIFLQRVFLINLLWQKTLSCQAFPAKKKTSDKKYDILFLVFWSSQPTSGIASGILKTKHRTNAGRTPPAMPCFSAAQRLRLRTVPPPQKQLQTQRPPAERFFQQTVFSCASRSRTYDWGVKVPYEYTYILSYSCYLFVTFSI
mgnify:CR=1 FL=1